MACSECKRHVAIEKAFNNNHDEHEKRGIKTIFLWIWDLLKTIFVRLLVIAFLIILMPIVFLILIVNILFNGKSVIKVPKNIFKMIGKKEKDENDLIIEEE